jgi:nicotinate-nucleotide adenylyltransferase
MKTGLFFGTFNPVHVGHLLIANYLTEFSDLDQVWIVVSPKSPFKQKDSMLADHHRLAMVERVLGDCNSKIKASRIEFDLPQPSYTSHTLAYLTEKYPARNFALIMGSDNLETFPKWKNADHIISLHEVYVYPRPGHDGGKLKTHPSVRWVDAPLMEISSSFIRKSVREGKNIRFFLQEAVFNYMTEMNFYKKA